MSNGVATLQIYLDEDVDVLLGPLLSSRAIDALNVRDAGLLGRADEQQLEFATAQGRILITHNRVDFERLAVAWWGQRKDHAGIILAIRRADTYELARHLLPVLLRFDQTGWRNCVLYA